MTLAGLLSRLFSKDDFNYITQELYKKNLELDDKNETLLLLEKIDEIILSKVVDLKEIANEVTKLLVGDAEFRLAAIYILSPRRKLWKLAVSVTDKINLVEKTELEGLLDDVAKYPPENNILYTVIDKKEMRSTKNPFEMLTKNVEEFHGAEDILSKAGLNTMRIYPLIRRGEAIGVVIFSLGKTDLEITNSEKDLLNRLSSVIAIAIDNTLLYDEAKHNSHYLKAEEHP